MALSKRDSRAGIPDFKRLHELERQRIEKWKANNQRKATVIREFKFSTEASFKDAPVRRGDSGSQHYTYSSAPSGGVVGVSFKPQVQQAPMNGLALPLKNSPYASSAGFRGSVATTIRRSYTSTSGSATHLTNRMSGATVLKNYQAEKQAYLAKPLIGDVKGNGVNKPSVDLSQVSYGQSSQAAGESSRSHAQVSSTALSSVSSVSGVNQHSVQSGRTHVHKHEGSPSPGVGSDQAVGGTAGSIHATTHFISPTVPFAGRGGATGVSAFIKGKAVPQSFAELRRSGNGMDQQHSAAPSDPQRPTPRSVVTGVSASVSRGGMQPGKRLNTITAASYSKQEPKAIGHKKPLTIWELQAQSGDGSGKPGGPNGPGRPTSASRPQTAPQVSSAVAGSAAAGQAHVRRSPEGSVRVSIPKAPSTAPTQPSHTPGSGSGSAAQSPATSQPTPSQHLPHQDRAATATSSGSGEQWAAARSAAQAKGGPGQAAPAAAAAGVAANQAAHSHHSHQPHRPQHHGQAAAGNGSHPTTHSHHAHAHSHAHSHAHAQQGRFPSSSSSSQQHAHTHSAPTRDDRSSVAPSSSVHSVERETSMDSQSSASKYTYEVERLKRLAVQTRQQCEKEGREFVIHSLEFYSIGKVIGEGAFGKVKLGRHRLSGEKVAIKMFEKSRLKDVNARKRVGREIANMERLDHACVIQFFEVIDSPKRIYLVMEYANGGDLCKYVRARKKLEEGEAKMIFGQIVAGLDYTHRQNIIHRDVKLENCLLDSDRNVKIVDFGFSVQATPGAKLKTFCGSPSYAAPEIISRKPYEGTGIDVWSMGVLLFGMLCGYFPFQGQSNSDLYRRIVRGEYKAPSFMSTESRDLLRSMLTTDPDRRFRVPDVARHPFVAPLYPKTLSKCKVREQRQIDDSLLEAVEELGFDKAYALKCLKTRAHNLVTTTYHLLVQQKERVQKEKSHSHSQSKLRHHSTHSSH